MRLCTQILLRCSMVNGKGSQKQKLHNFFLFFIRRGRCLPARDTLLTRGAYTSREIPYIDIGMAIIVYVHTQCAVLLKPQNRRVYIPYLYFRPILSQPYNPTIAGCISRTCISGQPSANPTITIWRGSDTRQAQRLPWARLHFLKSCKHMCEHGSVRWAVLLFSSASSFHAKARHVRYITRYT